MRVVPTGVHAVFDYTAGFLLVVAPWLFDFARGGAETWIAVLLAAERTRSTACAPTTSGARSA